MPSSFPSQIPIIVYLLQRLQPKTMLDVGKGFGKYGFLAHEYVGINLNGRPVPTSSLAEQSSLTVDAVEINEDYLWPHLPQFYRKIYTGRIEQIYSKLPSYDVVLMADVIEHIKKPEALEVVKFFVSRGSSVIVSSPYLFFDQFFCESEAEHHVSHWSPKDFDWCHHDWETVDGGVIYLLSKAPVSIRGFGRHPLTKLRRIARTVRDCIR